MKRNIKFDLFPQKVNGILVECRPIRMRVSYNGNRVDFRVGCSIEFSKWNAKEGRVIANARNRYRQTAGEINKTIIKCEEQIESIFTRFELLEKRVPTPAELKLAFNQGCEIDATEKKQYFKDVFEAFKKSMGSRNDWSEATFKKFNALKEHFIKVAPNISMNEINEELLEKFLRYMHKEDLRNTTISKYISYFRWFLRWCANNGYYSGNLHNTFRPKLKGTNISIKEIIYLEWEELLNLYSFQFSTRDNIYLSAIRDVFCFCCFTGLRYSDVAKLRRSDVKGNHISVVTQKTSEIIIIELNKYSRAILEKYKEVGLPNNLALPVKSNVEMNYQLKIIGKLAGITEPQRIVFFKGNVRYEEVVPKYALLTTHCGRRTFIVNGLRLGIPAEVIMKWTGHSDYEAMKPYIKIVDKLKVAEMEKFNTFSEKVKDSDKKE